MRSTRLLQTAFAAGLVLLAIGQPPLAAQTNLETNAGVQFNFSTPGAGNMALGGAFLALAFDASAAYTNPAGLTTIVQPESLVEARHWNYTHVFTDHGRIEGESPTCDGEDVIAGLRDGKAQNQVTGLSFVSYVYPRNDWSFSVFRHELVNFEAAFSTFGAYLDSDVASRNPLGIPGSLNRDEKDPERIVYDARLAALRNSMSIDVVAYGAAAAYRFGDRLSLGVAISYFNFSIGSTAQRYIPELNHAPDFEHDPFVNSQAQQGQDHDLGLNVGFLWESRQKRWSIGGVYREGPDFKFQTYSQPEQGAVGKFQPITQQATFHVPDVYGLGIAYRPRDSFRIALDYDRVLYSQLMQGFVDIFGLSELPALYTNDPELDQFVIDDAGEIHLGLEYAFLQRWPVLSLRAGAWHEPDHSVRFEGNNMGFRAIFRRREDHLHYTGGVGIATRRLQIDAAIDHSDRTTVLSLSAGFRH